MKGLGETGDGHACSASLCCSIDDLSLIQAAQEKLFEWQRKYDQLQAALVETNDARQAVVKKYCDAVSLAQACESRLVRTRIYHTKEHLAWPFLPLVFESDDMRCPD